MVRPVNHTSGLRVATMMAMAVIVLAGIKAASDIVVPLLLAIFLAIILYPVVKLLERIRVPRTLAITFLVLLFVFLLFLLLGSLASSLNEFTRSLPQYRGMALAKLGELQEQAARFNIDISTDVLVQYLDPSAAVNFTTRLIAHLSGAMTSIFLLLMTVVFMLFEVNILPHKLKQAMEEPEKSMLIIRRALNAVTRYLVLKTVISVATGIIIWMYLSAIGVRFAFMWGMLGFALNYIPNIGSVIAAIPPILQTLLFNGFSDALVVTGCYIAVNVIVGNIIDPRLMGRGLGLSTLVVFLSLIFWGWLLGLVGMLLSVPLTIVAKIALEMTPNGRKFAVMLGDGKPVRRED